MADPLAPARRVDRNVAAISAVTFLMTFGEELWKRFAPKYLEALGAPVTAIGLYGSVKDLLDGLYNIPGGWAADHLSRRRAFSLFVLLAGCGYALYALAPAWPVAFLALAFVMAWSAMASPAMFAVIADALPRGRRVLGFTVQAMVRRVPIVIAPALGGLLIARAGVLGGVRVGLAASVALAAAALVVVRQVRVVAPPGGAVAGIGGVWRAM